MNQPTSNHKVMLLECSMLIITTNVMPTVIIGHRDYTHMYSSTAENSTSTWTQGT